MLGGAYDGVEATAWSLDLLQWVVGLQQQRCSIKCPVSNSWSTVCVCVCDGAERGTLQQAI